MKSHQDDDDDDIGINVLLVSIQIQHSSSRILTLANSLVSPMNPPLKLCQHNTHQFSPITIATNGRTSGIKYKTSIKNSGMHVLFNSLLKVKPEMKKRQWHCYMINQKCVRKQKKQELIKAIHKHLFVIIYSICRIRPRILQIVGC